MSDLQLQIDGRTVKAEAGQTLLEAARGAGIEIPTLYHHEQLAPYGGCRLCIVEAEQGGRTQIVASCVTPAEDGAVVRTRTDKVDRIRRTLVELLMAHAPHAPQLEALAEELGAEAGRYEQDPMFCVHCGLCVRYCAEVKGHCAVGFIDRGMRKEISFIPQIAAEVCDDCKECFPLCPTSYLQAAYVLTESLALRGRG